MPHDPILHLIGLSHKAGRLEIGEEPVGAACRARHAKLILLASDAAPNTCRRAAHFGEAGSTLFLQLPFSKAELGFQLGRGSCAMLALTDPGFAAAIAEKLAARDPDRYGPAAQQLRVKADRAYQRQKEKRQHEKNLREGKRKPWAAPPKPSSPAKGREAPSAPTARKKAGSTASDPRTSRPVSVQKPGPGGRKLTARPGSIPKK